jgi:hypothetical protein
MKKNISKTIAAAITVVELLGCLAGCKSDSNKNAQELFSQNSGGGQKDSSTLHTRVNKVRDVFYTIPSSIEISQLLKESGAKYSETFPSDPNNVAKYTSKKGQAINLGIYAADLSYAGIYEQKEESMLYLKCANTLSTALGIPDAFGESTISRINDNMNNQDSLLSIITKDYWNTDKYLTNNDRPEISALIITGGWIEGLYIATQIATHSDNNPKLLNRVAEQKTSLDDLIDLVGTYPSEPTTQGVMAQLKKIQDSYTGITVENNRTKVSTDSSKNTTTIGGTEKVIMTPEQLKHITDVTAEVRNQIILEY